MLQADSTGTLVALEVFHELGSTKTKLMGVLSAGTGDIAVTDIALLR